MKKSCPGCKQLKDTDAGDFSPDKSKSSGFRSRCKDCCNAHSREVYAANPQKSRDWQRAWRATEKGKSKLQERRDRLRQAAFDAYGSCCSCCGETRPEFLTVEHVGGWGAEHRKRRGEGAAVIHQWLKKVGYPQDGTITLHCWNCNLAKGMRGYCPHDRETDETTNRAA